MDDMRLRTLLDRFPDLHVLVVGDYFLDRYLVIDGALSEVSLETGLEAYQVVEVRCSPGAAGTVTSNLRALGVGVTALGVIGQDGMGYELLRGLEARGVHTGEMVQVLDRFTPTYTKPMMRALDGGLTEMQRLDIKNRRALDPAYEEAIIERLRACVPQVDGVIIPDQVPEANFGVITDRVRAELAELAHAYPETPMVADSRERVGAFREVMLKPNEREATRAVRGEVGRGALDRTTVERCGATLYQRTGRAVFLTIGAVGMLVCDALGVTQVPGIDVTGPIDIVGAGDSALAGLTSALCAGATHCEAAEVGNLVASITIQQIGTTGTATPAQVLARHRGV